MLCHHVIQVFKKVLKKKVFILSVIISSLFMELKAERWKTMARFPIGIAIAVVTLFLLISAAYGINRISMRESENFLTSDYGEPLYLTPFVRSGEVDKARELSLVKGLPDTPKVASYSGFFTVNQTYNSNIFFWFVPAMNGNKNAPLLLWLQGGPGLTGLFGFFVEHGPYVIYSNMTAGLREYAWTNRFHVIYVDNPVGAGFSFTDDVNGYVRNQDQMAENMYEFLQQFFKVFYEYRNNEFYITGESYGGKYVPALSYKIHMEGNNSKINFKGMVIGNGLCDPETMMDYGDYFYQIGLVDRKEAKLMRSLSKTIVEDIRKKDYYKALVDVSKLILSFNVLPYTSYFKNFTDFQFFYNYLLTEEPADYEYYKTYLKSPMVRNAIHVGNLTFQDGRMAEKNLLLDIMQSLKPKVQVIMDNYRVLFFSGQLDLIIPYPMTVNFLHSVQWKYSEEYKNADRKIWKLKNSDIIAGYVHTVKEFYEIMVRDAGHILPYDKPRVALDLISRFLAREPFA